MNLRLSRFAYDFARSINDNSAQRTIDRETTTLMLNVLLRGRWVGLAKFLQFLEDTDVKVVNKDQWCSVYEFSHTVGDPVLHPNRSLLLKTLAECTILSELFLWQN